MRKPLTVAAYSGIAVLILSFVIPFISSMFRILGVKNEVLLWISAFNGIVLLVPTGLFVYGFVVLGRKYDSNLLRVISWISILLMVSSVIVYISVMSLGLLPDIPEIPEDYESLSGDEQSALLMQFIPWLKIILIYFIYASIVLGIVSIISGIALLKISKKVRYAKPAGVLKIIAGFTYIIFIGMIFRLIGYVFELMMMFSAAKKLERNAVSE